MILEKQQFKFYYIGPKTIIECKILPILLLVICAALLRILYAKIIFRVVSLIAFSH